MDNNNTLSFEINSEYVLRKMITNIISIYSFWDSVTYKRQPGTAYYRLLPMQTPVLFFIFLFNETSLSFHKLPHNPGSFPETAHQHLGKEDLCHKSVITTEFGYVINTDTIYRVSHIMYVGNQTPQTQ